VSVVKRVCVTELLINPIIQTRTRHLITRTPPTHDNINLELRSLGCEEVYLAKMAMDIDKMWASTCVVTNIQQIS
jgi:hypothetical protein